MFGSGGWIRTSDLEVNSFLRYRCATPEYACKTPSYYTFAPVIRQLFLGRNRKHQNSVVEGFAVFRPVTGTGNQVEPLRGAFIRCH